MSQNKTAVFGFGAIVLVGIGYTVYNGEKERGVLARAMQQGSSGGPYRIKRSGEGKAKEVRGLQNVGNTCFINVVLQSLASISPFVEYLQVQVDSPPASIYQRPFTSELLKMMTDLRPAHPPLGTLNPRKLRGLLAEKVERFKGFDQQDAQELFQMVIRLVSEEAEARPAAAGNGIGTHLKGLKLLAEPQDEGKEAKLNSQPAAMDTARQMRSPLNPLCGSLASITCCKECGKKSIRVEPFVDLSLTLPEAKGISGEYLGGGFRAAGMRGITTSPVRLEHILQDFTDEQFVEGVECLTCGEETTGAYKRMLLARPPETLCLHFPRRHPNPHGLMVKLKQLVKFPLKLNVAPFCCTGGQCTEGIAARQNQTQGAVLATTANSACDDVPRVPTTGRNACPGTESSLAKSPAVKVSPARASRSSPQSLNGLKHPALPGGSVESTETGPTTDTTATEGGRKRINGLEELRSSVNGSNGGGSSLSVAGYDLRAVIVHHGGAEGGHYTAFRNLATPADGIGSTSDGGGGMMDITQSRLGLRRPQDDVWVSLSDETVKTVSVSEVLKSQAYMLFYGRNGRRSPQASGLG